MLKVCLIAPLPPPYGGIAHWCSMVKRYGGVDPTLDITILDIASRWRPIHDQRAWVRALGGGAMLCKNIYSFLKIQTRGRSDVVHLTSSGHIGAVRDIAYVLLSRLLRIPFYYHIRFGRLPALISANSVEWRLIKFVMTKADSVILIDKSSYDSIVKLKMSIPAVCIPNFVDISYLDKIPEQPIAGMNTVLFCGHVIYTKGVEELLLAWDAATLGDSWKLKIFGKCSDDQYMSYLKDEYNLDNIEFMGEASHDDLICEVKSARFTVLPSHSEGFPNAVVESIAVGTPVIGTNVGAIPEILDGGAGLIVDVLDVEGLTQAIKKLANNPEMLNNIGAVAKAKALSEYDIDVVMNRYRSLWVSDGR